LSIGQAGHRVHEMRIVKDNRDVIRAIVAQWIADESIHGVLVTGGTGFTGRDSTPEALLPLLDKQMPGFGEMFRAVSIEEIGTSSLQSRAFAGMANGTFVFALPGSTSACRTAWEKILRAQLDARTRPCNLATLRPRLKE
jgi:molybdenum cofactor biosynthesis protein B